MNSAPLRFSFASANGENIVRHVDQRRFGTWQVVQSASSWGELRGPDPITEYAEFRENVLTNMAKAAFNHPICEVLLDQEYFNGIGNYLRAEIMHRADVRPFDRARTVLEKLPIVDDGSDPRDIIRLCKTIAEEAIALEFAYGTEESSEVQFDQWLKVYGKKEANSCKDSNARMVWFFGNAGPLLPAGSTVKRGAKRSANLKAAKKQSLLPAAESASTTAKSKPKSQKKSHPESPEKETFAADKPSLEERLTTGGTALPAEVAVSDPDVRRSMRIAQTSLNDLNDGSIASEQALDPPPSKRKRPAGSSTS
eukprot:ANDGO_03218.mRNA.2 hypothetical protein